MKIRGANRDGDENIGDGLIFVDDDCWQLCQQVGKNLGYFWCLSEFNKLTEDCTQNCAGSGVTMDTIRSVSSSSKNKKRGMDTDLCSFFAKNSTIQLEINLIRNELSSFKNNLLFLKTEKYEANKWILQT